MSYTQYRQTQEATENDLAFDKYDSLHVKISGNVKNYDWTHQTTGKYNFNTFKLPYVESRDKKNSLL